MVMCMNLDHGGHLTHGSPVNFSGLYFNIVPYGVDDEGFIDYDELERKAKEAKPKLIVAGASAYARTIDFKRFREIADEVGDSLPFSRNICLIMPAPGRDIQKIFARLKIFLISAVSDCNPGREYV